MLFYSVLVINEELCRVEVFSEIFKTKTGHNKVKHKTLTILEQFFQKGHFGSKSEKINIIIKFRIFL